MERVEHDMSGGFLVSFGMMAVTYASGWLLSLTGWLGEAWARVTPGQAALAVGLLTYATHHGPKLVRWARDRRRPRE